MKKTLFFFRHGLTDWNVQRRFQGHTDIALNEEGRTQARSLFNFFKNKKIDMVFSSPLSRAIETAQLATKSSEIHQMPHLIEVNLGEAEGVQETLLVDRFGEESLSRWKSFHPHDRDFGYPGSETKMQACERFHQAVEQIITDHSFQTAAICSHGFIMRRYFHLLIERQMGELFIPTQEEFPPIPNCQIYELESNNGEISFIQGPTWSPLTSNRKSQLIP